MLEDYYANSTQEKQRRAAVRAALEIVNSFVAAGNGSPDDLVTAEEHISKLADAIEDAMKKQ